MLADWFPILGEFVFTNVFVAIVAIAIARVSVHVVADGAVAAIVVTFVTISVPVLRVATIAVAIGAIAVCIAVEVVAIMPVVPVVADVDVAVMVGKAGERVGWFVGTYKV